MTLGFEGPRRALLRTAEVAARLGYPSLTAWYADAAKRKASGFPRPVRRGLYHMGRLQDWLDAGGFEQARGNQSNDQAGKGDQPENTPAGNHAGATLLSFSPRPEVAARLQAQRGAR